MKNSQISSNFAIHVTLETAFDPTQQNVELSGAFTMESPEEHLCVLSLLVDGHELIEAERLLVPEGKSVHRIRPVRLIHPRRWFPRGLQSGAVYTVTLRLMENHAVIAESSHPLGVFQQEQGSGPLLLNATHFIPNGFYTDAADFELPESGNTIWAPNASEATAEACTEARILLLRTHPEKTHRMHVANTLTERTAADWLSIRANGESLCFDLQLNSLENRLFFKKVLAPFALLLRRTDDETLHITQIRDGELTANETLELIRFENGTPCETHRIAHPMRRIEIKSPRTETPSLWMGILRQAHQAEARTFFSETPEAACEAAARTGLRAFSVEHIRRSQTGELQFDLKSTLSLPGVQFALARPLAHWGCKTPADDLFPGEVRTLCFCAKDAETPPDTLPEPGRIKSSLRWTCTL